MRIYNEQSTTLNLDAEEWQPEVTMPSPNLPLAIIQAPPPPPLQLFPTRCFYNLYIYTHIPQQPVYYLSLLPTIQLPVKAPAADEALDRGKKDVVRASLPPRLRRGSKAKNQLPSPPPPPRRLRRSRNKLPVPDQPPPRQLKKRNKLPMPDQPAPQSPKQQYWRLKQKSEAVSGKGGAAAAAILPATPSESKTTVMIKNIPNLLGRSFMLGFMDSYCRRHSLEYDFFYLPIDFRTSGNLGYAFVNFTTPAAAIKFMKVMKNYKWRTIYPEDGGPAIICSKIVETVWAETQGIESMRNRFRNSKFNCNDIDFLPVELVPPRNGFKNPSPPVILGKLCPKLK